MMLTRYLGRDVKELLASPPFSGWDVTRTVETDLARKEIWYEFEGHDVEVICDEGDRVRTIFLHRGDGEALSEIPFALSRREVLNRYGPASRSGEAQRHQYLGELGAWDRFTLPSASLHVQYRLHHDEIELITLMRPDAVP